MGEYYAICDMKTKTFYDPQDRLGAKLWEIFANDGANFIAWLGGHVWEHGDIQLIGDYDDMRDSKPWCDDGLCAEGWIDLTREIDGLYCRWSMIP